ncbi:MAG: hypothetical protein QF567_02075 [Candidatus Pacearchaeota archaeon]|jgi:hypothetical protein|nr:hypothetical protein [Candidatus Pacearchaeota archaeon]MDP7520998.1 hypothetical protein [Candidatus Pacearchaeota archaeon]|tara:strand:+ start:931 stop:1155 length:225 start_codon:yes stop_codon:yes gene_type:complete
MNRNLVIVGVLVLLVLISATQSIQLLKIKSDIKEVGTTTSIKSTSLSSSTSSSSSSGGDIPTNLQNLPGMVGGC